MCERYRTLSAFHARTGRWPQRASGTVRECPTLTWLRIQQALQRGHLGLPGGTSLARLLAEHRGARNRADPPPLTEAQIAAWAKVHYQHTGRWPRERSGRIPGTDETWGMVAEALERGTRGLPGGETLRRILTRVCSARDADTRRRPALTEAQILAWAERHYQRTGHWASAVSGAVKGVTGLSWRIIDAALRGGYRGLPGDDSLARLLARHEGRELRPGPLTVEQILAWADAHHERTGEWPKSTSGAVADAPGETWSAIRPPACPTSGSPPAWASAYRP
jgi:hypothetical protein